MRRLALAFLFSVACAPPSKPVWTPYQSPGGYSVELPGKPVQANETENTSDFGRLVTAKVVVEDPRDVFMGEAGHFDIPDGFNFIPQKLFDVLAEDLFEESQGTRLSSKSITIDGLPAAHYVYELKKPPARCALRTTVVRRRAIWVFGCSRDAESEVVTRVASSLKLTAR